MSFIALLTGFALPVSAASDGVRLELYQAPALAQCDGESPSSRTHHAWVRTVDLGQGVLFYRFAFSYDGISRRMERFISCESGEIAGFTSLFLDRTGSFVADEQVDVSEPFAALMVDLPELGGWADLKGLSAELIAHGFPIQFGQVRGVPCGCLAVYPELAANITEFSEPLALYDDSYQQDFSGSYNYVLD